MGCLYYRRGDLSVVRRDDQNIHAFREQVVALFRLHRVIAVGDLDFAFSADFLATLLDQSLVALPAFLFQSIHGKADAHRPA